MSHDRAWVEENVLTCPEAAEYLHMTRQGINYAVKTGALSLVKGKLLLKSELDEYNKAVEKRRPRSA
ncbi:hypothetical protein FACS1894216_02410 [Synergistales bacterium]|nr:hypothetical protein FACS1894216_02410 [Synergistales bacterium]